MMPSGQTYIHRHTRPNEPDFTTITFLSLPPNSSSRNAYVLNSRNLTGTIKLESGHQIYVILRHKPLNINWISYRYWLPLMTAIVFFIVALLYMLNRRSNWEQLLLYADSLHTQAKQSYNPPPFLDTKSTPEFLRLGHTLSRVSYQLHSDYRRIKTLTHRLDRLVNQAPLPMLMITRHGQIGFFNQRFEQIFISASQKREDYELTDFVAGQDTPTQTLLQDLSDLRVMRRLTVCGLADKHAYQIHITPWFGEHGQVHGFTALFNDIDDLITQTHQLQQTNQQLQQKIDRLHQTHSSVGRKLRVPLEAMIDLLEPIDPATLSAERHDVLETLIETSQSMLTTLNETLDIKKSEVRKTRLSIEPVDIYQLSKEVSGLVVTSIREQGLELIYFFAPECPRYIDTDEVRLRHILLSLLNNAVRFTTSGYVALTIDRVSEDQVKRLNHQHFTPSNNQPTNRQPVYWIRFGIKDTGVSLHADKKHQLTTLFNQDDGQTRHLDQKDFVTDIGLNSANSLAQLLGGIIELQKSVGEESIFNLYLPCRHPSYQPVYHRNQHLAFIHLIAIINQPLVAEQLQRLCDHLAISTTIYTSIDLKTVQQLTQTRIKDGHALTPILLLGYEYHKDSERLADDNDKRQALDALLAIPSLPKILFSMTPEHRIPTVLLDKYNGLLTKPLDANLLISELLRLTLPTRQKLAPQVEVSAAPDPSAAETAAPNETTSSPLILVAEDNPTNQKITCKILSKLGCRSVVAENGQQALERLRDECQDISLILMDCRMPVMDGLQATKAIRLKNGTIPIVALTANSSAEDREACEQAGMNGFLSKPVNQKDLKAVLEHLLKV